jgi:hypothetical protein
MGSVISKTKTFDEDCFDEDYRIADIAAYRIKWASENRSKKTFDTNYISIDVHASECFIPAK